MSSSHKGLYAVAGVAALAALAAFVTVCLVLPRRLMQNRRLCAAELAADSLLESELATGHVRVPLRPGRPNRLRPMAARAAVAPVAVPLVLSGAMNQALGRHRQALRQYRAVLSLERLIGDRKGMAARWWDIAEVYAQAGRQDTAARCYERSYGLYRLVGNDRRAVLALENAAARLTDAGRSDDAADRLVVAMTVNNELGDTVGMARNWTGIGYARHTEGDYDRAFAAYLASVELCRGREGCGSQAAIALGNLATVLAVQGEDWFRGQCELYGLPGERCDRLFEEVRAAYEVSPWDTCGTKELADWFPELSAQYRAMADSCLRAGDSAAASSFLGALGYLWKEQGRADSSLCYHRRAWEISRKSGNPDAVASASQALGTGFLAAGMADSAFCRLHEALVIYERDDDEYSRDLALWNLHQVLRDLGEDRFRSAARRAQLTETGVEQLLRRVRVAEEPVARG